MRDDRSALAPQEGGNIEKILTSPTTMLRLKEVLQKSVSVERFARVVLNVIRRTPKLLQCKQESLFGSILVLARWGLEPGTDSLAEAFLVPYKDECQPQASYRGLVKMVRRAAGNIPIWAEVVKEGDFFDYALGDSPYIHHKPSDDPDREERTTTHAYAVAKFSENEKQSVVMTRAQLDRIKNMSAAVKYKKLDSPWFTNPDEMDKKTVLRRLTKGLPMKMEDAAPIEEDTTIDIDKAVIDMPRLTERVRPAPLAQKVSETFDAPTNGNGAPPAAETPAPAPAPAEESPSVADVAPPATAGPEPTPQAPAGPQETHPEPAGPVETPAAAVEPARATVLIWKGKIVKAKVTKVALNPKKVVDVWYIGGSDGTEFSTTKSAIGKAAEALMNTGEIALVHYLDTMRGLDVVQIEAAR